MDVEHLKTSVMVAARSRADHPDDAWMVDPLAPTNASATNVVSMRKRNATLGRLVFIRLESSITGANA
jgi:hypothetical protein